MPKRGRDDEPEGEPTSLPESDPASAAAAGLPVGPIEARAPWGGRFGVGWERITRWWPTIAAAGREFGVDPAVMAGIVVIESGGEQERGGAVVERRDGYGGGPSVGLTQVKPELWQGLVPDADARTPEGNLRLGTAVMAAAIRRHGSWEEALRRVWFPGADANGTTQDGYVRALGGLIAEFKAAAEPMSDGRSTPVPTPAPRPRPELEPDPWRPYPWPAMRRAIVKKPGEGAGFDRCPPRAGRIVGFCTHITDGVPGGDQIRWYQTFFGTGGERAWDALTDLVMAQDGEVGILNDWRDPDAGGTRAGWANGTTAGLEGDGIAFYRRFPRINEVLVSCEHVARSGVAWTPAQLDATIELRTALAQELRCPWASYPSHPGFGGVSIEQTHTNFAAKACPAEPYLSGHHREILQAVKAKLKAWQGGRSSPTPVAAPEPPAYTRFGFTLEQVATFFGTMTRHNQDGTTDALPFDLDGPLSLLWLHRCEAEGRFPEAEEIRIFDARVAEGEEWWATWEGGWTAWCPLAEGRAGWRWLDEGS